MTGRPAFSAAGQNQSAVPSVSHAACAPTKFRRTPRTPGKSLRVGKRCARSGLFSGMRAMMPKRPGIALDRLLRIVEPLAFERRRNDHDALYAGLIEHRDHPLDREGFRKLRGCAWYPRPLWRVGGPEVNLRVGDQPPRIRAGQDDAPSRQRDPRGGEACENAAAGKHAVTLRCLVGPSNRLSLWPLLLLIAEQVVAESTRDDVRLWPDFGPSGTSAFLPLVEAKRTSVGECERSRL